MPVPAGGSDAGQIGDPYATAEELKTRIEISTTNYDGQIDDALATASREVESYCSRQFNRADVATARVYAAEACSRVDVDDFYTVDGLTVSVGVDGVTYPTAWATSYWLPRPLGGVVNGVPGWPYYQLAAASGLAFTVNGRPTVQVTARWGWQAVPAPVKQATLILAGELLKLKDAPFGVAGFGEFGAVRVRDNPRARSLLAPYRRYAVLVA